jgi:hypothetical protein
MVKNDFISRNNKLRHGDLLLCTSALMAGPLFFIVNLPRAFDVSVDAK